MADSAAVSNYGSVTAKALRRKISVMVGHRPPRGRGGLKKGTLNSIYAYLTGEFYYPPRVENLRNAPEYRSKAEVLNAVVWKVEIPPVEYPSDSEWFKPEWQPEQMRKGELYQLHQKLVKTPDQRSWTPDGE